MSFKKHPLNKMGIARKASERGRAPLCGKGYHTPKQITLTFLQYYYLLKSLLFKLLLLSPQARSVIGRRCSEDIIFWLEFFVKLPPQNKYIEEHSRVPVRREDALLSNNESNTTSIKSVRKATEGGVCDSFGQAFFSKGGGSNPLEKGLETLSNRIKKLKNSFKPRTSYNIYYWLKYKKDYILEIKERIENNKPLLVAKSANMDETTCTALVLLWFWLYKENANFYILGQTAKHLYYTKDNHSIFNLYKYVLNNLPYSLYKTDKDPPKTNKQNKLPYKLTVNRKKKFFVKLTNLNNGNTIYGFSGSKRNYFPQHKQIKAVWLNNFAFHKKQHEHYNVLQNISNCLIVTSIPNGNGNLFYELSMSKRIDRYKLHWVLNPHYDEKWYSNVIANTELNNVHQFLDIGYEYKIKRKRTIRKAQPVKKAAKKVAVVQATTRTKSSTFCKTFTATRNSPRKIYHRNSFAYTPDNYETVKKSLANTAMKAINIPSANEEKFSTVIRWRKMNKLIRQNNKVQITSVQTALKVLFHHQPELTNVLLQRPQMPIVNNGIKNQYTEEELKRLFPGVENENEKKNPPQSEEEIIKHINKIAVRKYNPMGIAGKASERGNDSLKRHCERSAAIQDQHTSDINNNQETNTTSNKSVGKATEGGVCDSFGSSPFLKGLGCEEQSDEAIQNQPPSDLNNDHKTNNNDKEKSSNALRGLQRGETPLHAVDRAAGGEDTLPPENKKLNKQEQFFNQYKKKKNYKVRSTRFNITIKPPKHKQNNNKGIDAESTERGESPLCGKWHLPPPKFQRNNNNKEPEEPP